MIRVDVWVADPAAVVSVGAFGAGALARLERSPTQTGAYTEVHTLPLEASSALYTWWDPAGDASTWYRWRVSDGGNSVGSDYSDPFQGTSPAATVFPTSYADLERLLGLFETRPTQPARLARFGQLLGTATAQVIEACGHRDYFRHPATGTATWIVDGDGSGVLHVHEGLVSLTLLELSFDGGLTYVPVTASDYTLRGDSPWSAEPIPPGEPFFHVRFTGFGQYTNVVATVRAARLTGARGWPAIPEALVEATAQRARQLAYAEASYSGAAAGGMDQFGQPATTDRFWPQSLYNFLQAERERFMGCHLGSLGSRQYSWSGR